MRRFHRRLLLFVIAVVSHPRLTLVLAGIVLLAAVVLAGLRLNITADQNKLFDPRVPFFRDYLRFVENFPENEAIYVVVRARDGSRVPPVARWTAAADAIEARLKPMTQFVRTVDAKVPLDRLGAQGLLFDEPARVRQSFEDVKRFVPLVKLWGEKPGLLASVLGPTPIERFVTSMQLAPRDEETKVFLGALAESWNYALEHPDEPLRPGRGLPDLASLDASDPSRLGYYYVPDEAEPGRRLMLVRVYPIADYASLTSISETVEAIEGAVRDAAGSYPEFAIGVTGRPALEAYEMRTTDRDSHRAEAVALVAVFVGLVVMLRSVWLALAGEVALGVGIGWTFGWATLSVGELNLLSIVFLLALIGIGMDYLVQILTRYRQEAARRSHASTIWVGVFRHVAAPINTACLGAAGAFLISVLTDFRGAAQLGIVAGGGLLLCLLAGYVVLPALLTLFPAKVRAAPARSPATPVRARGGWNLVGPVVWCSAILAASPLAFRTGFDPNLLKLQAEGHESVQLIRHLETWSAVELSKDLDVLRAVRKEVSGSPLVSRTESILTAYDNLAWLREHAGELPTIDWADPQPVEPQSLPTLAKKVRALADACSRADETTRATSSPAGGASGEVAARLARFADVLARATGPEAERVAERLSAWQRGFVAQLKETLAQFNPGDLDIARLPPELRSHFVGNDGAFALYIYPRADLWEQANLATFVRDVEARVAAVPGAPRPTGIAVNIHHSTASIEKSFYTATAYALGLIFVLVFLDFRKLGPTLLAISVLGFGLPMLVIVMGLLGVDWNFANFFALPILIGAGHEYGVFLVHRYREARRDVRRAWRPWDVSDRALLLCAYVTCTSFGFFWLLASHRGLKSLGLVMTLGTACIYVSAVVVLRPLLIWRLERRATPKSPDGR
jgi:predicted RND superfamily exporter protein